MSIPLNHERGRKRWQRYQGELRDLLTLWRLERSCRRHGVFVLGTMVGGNKPVRLETETRYLTIYSSGSIEQSITPKERPLGLPPKEDPHWQAAFVRNAHSILNDIALFRRAGRIKDACELMAIHRGYREAA